VWVLTGQTRDVLDVSCKDHSRPSESGLRYNKRVDCGIRPSRRKQSTGRSSPIFSHCGDVVYLLQHSINGSITRPSTSDLCHHHCRHDDQIVASRRTPQEGAHANVAGSKRDYGATIQD